jgi:hypothetical protein
MFNYCDLFFHTMLQSHTSAVTGDFAATAANILRTRMSPNPTLLTIHEINTILDTLVTANNDKGDAKKGACVCVLTMF